MRAEMQRSTSFRRAEFAVVALAVAACYAAACGQTHDRDRAEPAHDAGADPAGEGAVPLGGRTGGRSDAGGNQGTSGTAGSTAGAGGGGGDAGGGAGNGGTRQPCARTDDNASGALELVTLSIDCAAADGDAAFASLTPDARYVAFTSDAGDLLPNDLNGADDAFLYDLETRELELISNKHGTDETPMGHSYIPVLSDDARYIAFTAYTFELTSPPPSTGGLWIYLKDRQRGTMRRLTADYACAYWIDMSGDAAFIVAEGYTNCQGSVEDGDYDSTYEYDVFGDGVRALGMLDGADNYRPAISRDGRFIVWATRPPMTRGGLASQLQVFDREADTVETLPFLAFNYESIDVSDAGNILAFSENGQVYRYDRDSEELTTVSLSARGEPGDDTSAAVSLSGDGRYLVFASSATNLVDGDANGAADVLLYDADGDSLERISVAPDGTQADGDSGRPFISGDGSKVSFISKARNLLPAATSGNFQLYVRTLAVD